MQLTTKRIVAKRRKRRLPRLPVHSDIQKQILMDVHELRVRDPELIREFIRERQQLGVDQHDEVWEGVYVVPPLPTNPHQNIVQWLSNVLFNVINLENRGSVFPGANVSDRRDGWSHSFRAPDIVAVLNGSTAEDCGTHWFGGPDFLVEVRSGKPDVVEEKLPFYARIGVRELLVVDRDSREMTLYRSDGNTMRPVDLSTIAGKKWLVSAVLPLAIKRTVTRRKVQTEVIRTDGQPSRWLF
ncbi:MAG TPA: Uma2 family endonuclease [Gemmataceae bacterium]|nr:Uma2 family endonuclease [Gemmataceae bacterium]